MFSEKRREICFCRPQTPNFRSLRKFQHLENLAWWEENFDLTFGISELLLTIALSCKRRLYFADHMLQTTALYQKLKMTFMWKLSVANVINVNCWCASTSISSWLIGVMRSNVFTASAPCEDKLKGATSRRVLSSTYTNTRSTWTNTRATKNICSTRISPVRICAEMAGDLVDRARYPKLMFSGKKASSLESSSPPLLIKGQHASAKSNWFILFWLIAALNERPITNTLPWQRKLIPCLPLTFFRNGRHQSEGSDASRRELALNGGARRAVDCRYLPRYSG